MRKITIPETYEIITTMKTTNSTGYDSLNSRMMKEIPHIMALLMTHLINSILRTSKFPKCLKVTRLIPICKPRKSKTKKESYRPIANLNILEKVIEEWMKRELIKYIEKNKIILKNHHG